MLISGEYFTTGEKFSFRWTGPWRVIMSRNDHVYQGEDLCNGSLNVLHGSRLKFYHDRSLEERSVISDVVSLETSMPVARLMALIDDPNGLIVHVRWKGLEPSEDT